MKRTALVHPIQVYKIEESAALKPSEMVVLQR